MDDPYALVVGASSEIGRAIAVDLASLGMSPILWGRDRDRLRATADACPAPQRCTVSTVDVTDPAALREAVAALPGDGRLTVVAYAAGVFDWAPADEADPDAWHTVLDVNLTAAATLTRLVLPSLIAAAP